MAFGSSGMHYSVFGYAATQVYIFHRFVLLTNWCVGQSDDYILNYSLVHINIGSIEVDKGVSSGSSCALESQDTHLL